MKNGFYARGKSAWTVSNVSYSLKAFGRDKVLWASPAARMSHGSEQFKSSRPDNPLTETSDCVAPPSYGRSAGPDNRSASDFPSADPAEKAVLQEFRR